MPTDGDTVRWAPAFYGGTVVSWAPVEALRLTDTTTREQVVEEINRLNIQAKRLSTHDPKRRKFEERRDDLVTYIAKAWSTK